MGSGPAFCIGSQQLIERVRLLRHKVFIEVQENMFSTVLRNKRGSMISNNGIRNIMEDQYPPIYISIILKSYLARKRRLADGDTKRKLADTQTDTLT